MKRIYSLLLALLLLASGSAIAEWAEYPTGGQDARTAKIQEKVETLYRRGDYKRAHFIYSKELAPRGDKYAQYMAGYMFLMGQGVEEDPVLASAWYRLAAERRTPEFVAVRDQLLRTLRDDQLTVSDASYLNLRRQYSDIVIVMGMIVEELPLLNVKRTGSRVSGGTRPVTVIDPNSGIAVSSEFLRNRVLRAIQLKLDFVTEKLDIDDIRSEDLELHVESLRERIDDYLSVVDDRTDAYVANPSN